MVDRPLDCSECKRPISTQLTELIGDKVVRHQMCSECPHLHRHPVQGTEQDHSQWTTMMVCGGCHTSLDSIRMGHPLGCRECYEVFGEVILDELIKGNLISRHFSGNPRLQPIHMGRSPGEVSEISTTLRLIALNEALDETLSREDYEQAAFLRDQIEQLKGDPHHET